MRLGRRLHRLAHPLGRTAPCPPARARLHMPAEHHKGKQTEGGAPSGWPVKDAHSMGDVEPANTVYYDSRRPASRMPRGLAFTSCVACEVRRVSGESMAGQQGGSGTGTGTGTGSGRWHQHPPPPPATGLALAWLAHVGGLAHVTPASEWACLAPEGSATSPLRPSVRPSARRVDPFHLAARAVGGALN